MTVPTLTPRAELEQATFRILLNSMSHPGTIHQLGTDGGNPLVAIAETLMDHEVTFAVAPEQLELTDAILRQTGSHVADLDVAQYVFCDTESLAWVMRVAADGTPDFPDAGATIVCLASAIEVSGELVLSGPGIRETVSVGIEGFSPQARRTFSERNEMRPLGLDIIFVTVDGVIVSLTRYTRLQEE